MILVFDTVSRFCICGLYQGETCLARLCEDLGKGHGEHLIDQMRALLHQTGMDKTMISHIGVCTGPGSFTGMRIGVATARALALSLNVGAVGVSRFEALYCAMQQKFEQGKNCTVILPGPQDKFFVQFFNAHGVALDLPHQATIEEIAAQKPQLILSSQDDRETIIAALKGCNFIDFEILTFDRQTEFDALASIITAMKLDGKGAQQSRPSPLYMRAPDAKLQTPLNL